MMDDMAVNLFSLQNIYYVPFYLFFYPFFSFLSFIFQTPLRIALIGIFRFAISWKRRCSDDTFGKPGVDIIVDQLDLFIIEVLRARDVNNAIVILLSDVQNDAKPVFDSDLRGHAHPIRNEEGVDEPNVRVSTESLLREHEGRIRARIEVYERVHRRRDSGTIYREIQMLLDADKGSRHVAWHVECQTQYDSDPVREALLGQDIVAPKQRAQTLLIRSKMLNRTADQRRIATGVAVVCIRKRLARIEADKYIRQLHEGCLICDLDCQKTIVEVPAIRRTEVPVIDLSLSVFDAELVVDEAPQSFDTVPPVVDLPALANAVVEPVENDCRNRIVVQHRVDELPHLFQAVRANPAPVPLMGWEIDASTSLWVIRGWLLVQAGEARYLPVLIIYLHAAREVNDAGHDLRITMLFANVYSCGSHRPAIAIQLFWGVKPSQKCIFMVSSSDIMQTLHPPSRK